MLRPDRHGEPGSGHEADKSWRILDGPLGTALWDLVEGEVASAEVSQAHLGHEETAEGSEGESQAGHLLVPGRDRAGAGVHSSWGGFLPGKPADEFDVGFPADGGDAKERGGVFRGGRLLPVRGRVEEVHGIHDECRSIAGLGQEVLGIHDVLLSYGAAAQEASWFGSVREGLDGRGFSLSYKPLRRVRSRGGNGVATQQNGSGFTDTIKNKTSSAGTESRPKVVEQKTLEDVISRGLEVRRTQQHTRSENDSSGAQTPEPLKYCLATKGPCLHGFDGVVGLSGEGRSSSSGLLKVCRQAAAVQLVCRIRLCLRYVPSELNLADGPSRGLGISVAKDTVKAHALRGLPRRSVAKQKFRWLPRKVTRFFHG